MLLVNFSEAFEKVFLASGNHFQKLLASSFTFFWKTLFKAFMKLFSKPLKSSFQSFFGSSRCVWKYIFIASEKYFTRLLRKLLGSSFRGSLLEVTGELFQMFRKMLLVSYFRSFWKALPRALKRELIDFSKRNPHLMMTISKRLLKATTVLFKTSKAGFEQICSKNFIRDL